MKTLLTVALCLLAVPALAAPPAPTPSLAAPAAMPGAPAFVAALMPAPLAEATLSTCIATCQDGSTVTCTGTSCTAQDSACSQYQQGQCWSDAQGTQLCPSCDCPPSIRFPYCDELEGTSCTSGTKTCRDRFDNCRRLPCACHDNVWLCA